MSMTLSPDRTRHFGQLYGGRQAARVELIQRRKTIGESRLPATAGLSQAHRRASRSPVAP